MMLHMFGIPLHVLPVLDLGTVIPITTDHSQQHCIHVQCRLLLLLLLLPNRHDVAE